MSLRWVALWPRSIRGQVTLLTLMVAALILVPLGIAADTVIRDTVANSIWRETRAAATRTVVAYRDSTLRNPIPPSPHGVDIVQLAGPGGRLLASTVTAEGLPTLGGPVPASPDHALDYTICPGSRIDCYHVTAILTGTMPSSPIVYAAEPTPGVLSSHILDFAIGLQTTALIGLIGWLGWSSVDRNVRIVENIQAQLTYITVSDLSRRVKEPTGQNEIAALARTVNNTLARLEHSVEQQRRFAADASHELRTPIAGLRAQLEEARIYPDQTDLQTLVTGALRDTDRLEAIVTDLLFMARLGSSSPAVQELVDLGDLANEAISQRPSRIPVIAELQEGVTVLGVRTQLFRLLDNLLCNAQRHASELVKIEVRSEHGTALLAVTNDGDRIAEQDRERIFHRFTRLDESRSRDRGGTGLGLAIARDVAIAHGGTLHVEDIPEGTRFVLRLPLTE